jgi:hypothetical protein
VNYAHATGETQAVTVLRIGPELVFGRLWKESGIQQVIEGLLEARRYEFDGALIEARAAHWNLPYSSGKSLVQR